VYKGEMLGREEQSALPPEAPATEEPARKPRRVAKPSGDGSEKPKSRARVKQAPSAEQSAPEAKAPAKRVRKAGTTDAATR
jgi:hypothetical protein